MFDRRNLDILDSFLDENYFDEDIGDPKINHIQNSKEFLAEWFKEQPTLGIDVMDAIAQENVISAFLQWHVTEANAKKIVQKGVAIFVVKNQRIARRHTWIYYK